MLLNKGVLERPNPGWEVPPYLNLGEKFALVEYVYAKLPLQCLHQAWQFGQFVRQEGHSSYL